jgi:hypothetical protein
MLYVVGGTAGVGHIVKLKRSLAALLMLAMFGTLVTACGPNNSPSKFGVSLFGDDSRSIDLMQQAGFKWVRLFMFWDQLETSRGGYDAAHVASYDAMLTDLSHRGFSVMVVLQLTPRWAMTSPPKTGTCSWDPTAGAPADKAYFQEFTTWAANRYQDRVAAWELWNEPDGNCSFPGSPKQFRQTIAAPGFDGLKSADPHAVVLGPGLGDIGVAPTDLPGIWDNYLTELDAGGNHRLIRPIDGLAVHAYGGVRRIEDKVDAASGYHRCYANDGPCLGAYWLTEFGFNEPRPAGTGCWVWYGCDDDPGGDATQIFDYCRARSACAHALYWSSAFDDWRDGVQKSALALLDPNTKAPRAKYDVVKRYILAKELALPPVSSSAIHEALAGGSFEGGDTGWSASGTAPGVYFTIYNDAAVAHDGASYGAANSSTGGSIFHDASLSTGAGDAIVASAWVRAQDSPADGSFCVYALGGTIEGNCQRYSVTNGSWQRLEVVLNPTAAHNSARVQLFLGAGTTRVDTVSMHSERSIVRGSFEGGRGTWQVSGGANLASYRDSTLAHDGAGFAATNAPSVGGSIVSDVAVFGDAGDAFVASAWVRAQDVTADGAFCVYGLDGTVEASCQHYSVDAGAWQRVEVVLDTTTRHTFARVQVWPGAGTTRIDTATLHKERP